MINGLNKLKEELKGRKFPLAFLVEENFNHNVEFFARESGDKLIRVATKSIRSLEVLKLLREKLGAKFNGLMCYSASEALWLLEEGFKNILIAYPVVNKNEIQEVINHPNSDEVYFMVDSKEHVDILSNTQKEINICIDIDLSMKLPGLNFGVYRSSIKNLNDFKDLFSYCEKVEKLSVKAVMGYEAQIAGVRDVSSSFIENLVVPVLKKKSIKKLKKIRAEIITWLNEKKVKLDFVNAGGTGSIDSSVEEEFVTEITIGSGFYAPGLFDGYKNLKLKPSLFFALEVTRNPEPGIYTLYGGGYVASGSIGLEKVPKPIDLNVKLVSTEMCGEVQTPFKSSYEYKLGDPVIFRHAKAGELLEHFNSFWIREKNIEYKTYRGMNKKF